jgi:UDP-N-acetylglucosamine:LPS N-acetylglucosamine transferase
VAQLGKTTIDLLADNNRRSIMSQNIKRMALNNAAQKIVDRLEELVK